MERKHIRLTTRNRAELERFCTTGVHSVRLVDRAKIIRNESQKGVDWQFKTKDARIRLKKLYPIIM